MTGKVIVAHVLAFLVAPLVAALFMLVYFPVGALLKAIRVRDVLWIGAGWFVGGGATVWVAQLLFAWLNVAPGLPLLAVLLVGFTWNNLRRVRGAIAVGNRQLARIEFISFMCAGAGVIVGWTCL